MNSPPDEARGGLDPALATLRSTVQPGGPLGTPEAPHETRLPGGLLLHADPEGLHEGRWSSPSGRLLELTVEARRPGRWLALHVPLEPWEPTGTLWVALLLRATAYPATVLRPALRRGRAEGFEDLFGERHLLAQGREGDGAVLWPLDRLGAEPGPWREMVLFLPSAASFRLSLHALRVLAA